MKKDIMFNMCGRKRNYKTKSEAKKVANRMKRSGSKGVRPYKCDFCEFWHNGHPKDNPIGPDGLIIDEI